jgi:hypothetical protein
MALHFSLGLVPSLLDPEAPEKQGPLASASIFRFSPLEIDFPRLTVSSTLLQSLVKPPSVFLSPVSKRSLLFKASSAAYKNSSTFLGSKRRLSANGSWLYFFSNSQNSSFGPMSFPGCCSTQSRKDLLVTLLVFSSKYSSLNLSSNLVHEVTCPHISYILTPGLSRGRFQTDRRTDDRTMAAGASVTFFINFFW